MPRQLKVVGTRHNPIVPARPWSNSACRLNRVGHRSSIRLSRPKPSHRESRSATQDHPGPVTSARLSAAPRDGLGPNDLPA